MLTMLAVALVGDLLLLPAILSGPLGRFFEKRTKEGRGVASSPSGLATEQPESPASREPFSKPPDADRRRVKLVRQDRPHR
jgi:hypothetical protein